MNTLLRDLSFAFRVLRKRPGFTLVILLTLAMGIGANTAVFSVVSAVMLRPLELEEPRELVSIRASIQPETYPFALFGVSYANFTDWKEQSDSFESMGAYQSIEVTQGGIEQPERLDAAYVSDDFFPTLRINAERGRLFAREDMLASGDNVVIVTRSFCHRRFESVEDAIGQSILLDNESYSVVGVLPAGFCFPLEIPNASVFLPIPIESGMYRSRGSSMLHVVARLKSGASMDQARLQMETIAGRLAQQYPRYNPRLAVQLHSLHEAVVGDTRPQLLLLAGAVCLVLLIACTNVANLLLVRSSERQRELAVRAAMGASKGRLLRQMITESTLLGIGGGALGLVFAIWATSGLVAILPDNIPRTQEIGVSGTVLLFTLAISVVTGALLGLPAALCVNRSDLGTAIKDNARTASSTGRNLFQKIMVASEVALAIVLLFGAGLLLRSFDHVVSVDPGFDPDSLLTFRMEPGNDIGLLQRNEFFMSIQQRLASLPGIKAVGAAYSLPLTDDGLRTSLRSVDGPLSVTGQSPIIDICNITPGFLTTMGIPLIGGRLFTDEDFAGGNGVALISQTLAQRFWPGEDPIGIRIIPGATIGTGSEPDSFEIVGIVGDVRGDGLESSTNAHMYVPNSQQPRHSMSFVMKVSGDPMAMAPTIRSEIATITKSAAPYAFSTMSQRLSGSLATRRFPTFLLSIFAAMAVSLCAIGIYGLLSYTTGRRTHEIGIRLALGAERSSVLRLVMRQGLSLAGVGLAIGLVLSIALSKAIADQLFETSSKDPLTLVAVTLVMLCVASLACLIPAVRATRVDPIIALRCQ